MITMKFLLLLSLLALSLADTQDSNTAQPSEPTVTTTTTTVNTPLTNIYAGLILPQVRMATNFTNTSKAICGGTVREKVHFITTQEHDCEFKWYIETPSSDGVCLFRISENVDQSNDSAYINLIPLDRTDINVDGSFPCGRTGASENAFFDIPTNIDCDSCVLEWIWKAGGQSVRQCADIMVLGGVETDCVGQCLNGGVCQRGACVCPAGYSGTYCENAVGAISRTARNILAIIFFILLAIILIILIIMLLYWCAKKRIREGEKEQIYHTNKKYVEFDVELPSQPHGVDRPAELVRAESQSEY